MARTLVAALSGYTVERTMADDPVVTLVAHVGGDEARRVEIKLDYDGLRVFLAAHREVQGGTDGA